MRVTHAKDPDSSGWAERPDPPVIRAVEAFELFYGREYRKVLALAFALTGRQSVAEDLAQDAFLAAHRKWDEVGAYEHPDAWVRQVLRNMAASFFRRKAVEARALARVALDRDRPSPSPALSEDSERFWHAVARLPRRQAEAVVLFYLDELSVAEVADIMSCSEGTVKTHLHRARLAITSILGLQDGGES
jgi:RNA polymerase sigma-70 factor (ECF subfamily)